MFWGSLRLLQAGQSAFSFAQLGRTGRCPLRATGAEDCSKLRRFSIMPEHMNTLVLEQDPVATGLKFTEAYFIVELADGRLLSIPLAWYPRLAHATAQELANWHFLGDGYAIEWPELDEHIGIEGLLAG
jgi:hypothetical protein